MKEVAMVEFSKDIVTEILLRLPVKSLLTFKTVCKTWFSIISSTMFVREHLKRAHATRYNQRKNFIGILDAAYYNRHWYYVGILDTVLFKEDSDGVVLAKNFDFLTEYIVDSAKEDSTWARNSCDGLICFQKEHDNTVAIWNPSLPTEYAVIHSFFTGSCAIGYDPCADDYKIVSVPYYSADKIPCAYIEVQLFSLKGDSWRTVRITKTMDYRIENTKVIYTKNRLHWLARDCRYKENESEDEDEDDDDDEVEDVKYFLVYFDLIEESLDYLNVPSSSYRHPVPLNYKDSLGILCFSPEVEGEIWVLQDYRGMKSLWTKIFKIPYIWIWNCCFTLKGDLLFSGDKGLAIVDAKDGSGKTVECEGYGRYYHCCCLTSPYVESLISPRSLH